VSKLAAGGVEIEAGLAEGGVIEAFGQGGEIAETLLERLVAAWRLARRVDKAHRAGALNNLMEPQTPYPPTTRLKRIAAPSPAVW
jgi:hypothetical protein